MDFYYIVVYMRGSSGGVGWLRTPFPWNLQSLISPILLKMKKNSYFSYLCTSTVIRQTESILLKVGPPPLEKFSGSAPAYRIDYNRKSRNPQLVPYYTVLSVKCTCNYLDKNLFYIQDNSTT